LTDILYFVCIRHVLNLWYPQMYLQPCGAPRQVARDGLMVHTAHRWVMYNYLSSVIQWWLKSLYQDYTHIPGNHHFIYQQPPAESDNEELWELFKFLSTTVKA